MPTSGGASAASADPSASTPRLNSLHTPNPTCLPSQRQSPEEEAVNMTSSVARIPMASFKDRLPQSCVVISCGVGGGRGGFGGGDAADAGYQPSPPVSPCSSCSDASSSAVEHSSSSCSRRRQQSRILDRWAAHQARDMVTTVERQAHEAELSALSAASEPVSARAATFLHREAASAASALASASASASPPSGSSLGGRGGVDDLPPNVRASSLIQMWRELEADTGIAPSPRAAGGGGGGGNLALESTGGGFSFAEEACGSSEACDDSEWGPELVGPSKHHRGLADGEREHVGDLVKSLSSGSETQSSSTYGTQENAPSAHERSLPYRENADSVLLKGTARQLKGWRKIDGLLARMKQERQRELGGLMDSTYGTQENAPSAHERSLPYRENTDSVLLKGTVRQLKGWRKIDGLLARMKQERQQELDGLMDCRPVSRFSHRSRIQSLLRFRGPHRLLMIQDQGLPDSTALELDSLRQRGSTIWFLRERFSPRCQQGNNVGQAADGKDILLRDNSLGLNYTIVADQPTSTSLQDQKVAVANDSQTILEDNLSLTTTVGLQEDSQTSAFAWQENNLQISNIDWQSAIDSSNLDNWEGDFVTEESDSDSQNIVEDANGTCPNNASHGHIGWENHRQAVYHEQNGNYPDSAEVRELLQRKPVSSSLASNFREIMDRLVLSLVQRQQSMFQSIAEEEVLPVQRQDDGFIYADQAASSFSLMPLSCQTFCSPDSHQGSCLTYQSSHQFLETELIHDLRNDVAEIHHEMGELQKMIGTCLDGQSKLQNLIREEVSSMVYNTVGMSLLLHSSKWAPTKKGNCCVCHEMQIDSLLYRCGHMCACYKCAQELQWSAGRCPICRAPIIDVVRPYSEA